MRATYYILAFAVGFGTGLCAFTGDYVGAVVGVLLTGVLLCGARYANKEKVGG